MKYKVQYFQPSIDTSTMRTSSTLDVFNGDAQANLGHITAVCFINSTDDASSTALAFGTSNGYINLIKYIPNVDLQSDQEDC